MNLIGGAEIVTRNPANQEQYNTRLYHLNRLKNLYPHLSKDKQRTNLRAQETLRRNMATLLHAATKKRSKKKRSKKKSKKRSKKRSNKKRSKKNRKK